MSKNVFNSVQYPQVGSNTFDLSHDVKMSFNMGRLYPTLVMDCIPGDRVRLSSETMLRFAPLIAPVMHRVNVTTHYFFVPNRIIWPNWEEWITGNLETEPPFFNPGNITESSVCDYMGIPVGLNVEEINALPFAALRKIWNEYYRDQNLQNALDDELSSGDNSSFDLEAISQPYFRAWQHDYFTASLPFAQKGDAVTLPLINAEGTIPVQWIGNGNAPIIRYITPPLNAVGVGNLETGSGGLLGFDDGSFENALIDPNGTLVVNAEGLDAEAATINTLRRAFRLQEWLEKNARGGTRYIENIMAHFGVKTSDYRLQRPEFLGGSYQKMVISEVLSTAESTEVPVGQMAGHGIAVGSGKEFTYRCEEHGWIIGLINVQPVTAYQQGLNKMYSRPDRLDYLWPTFAHIGEQEVLQKEVYMTDDAEANNGVFGYVPRYSEYRFINSRVAGEMRSSLNMWHLGRIFETPPALNATFIASDPSTRIFAVEANADHIYAHIFNDISALRKLPKYGTPSF